jgi:NAD(P)-dependent dehydrogenase (short-subunit alcohol dehydrogenase family)
MSDLTQELSLSSLSRYSARHILITGTSTGIGRACALRLAGAGYSIVAGVRTDADAKSILHAGAAALGRIHPVLLDVTQGCSIRSAAAQIRSLTGNDGLCGLVNNAGICVVGPAECVSLQEWRQQFEVNLFGAIAVTQAVLPLLRQHNAVTQPWAARIVNMCSITGEVATPLFGAYSASKFALSAFSDALRLELRAHAIHVSTLVPGTIQSEIWKKEKQAVEAIPSDSTCRQLYGKLIDNVAGYVFKCADKAIPADRVAHAVQRCFAARNPRIRYRVGWEADVGSRARKIIPDRLFDYLLGRTLGVPRASAIRSVTPSSNADGPLIPAEGQS